MLSSVAGVCVSVCIRALFYILSARAIDKSYCSLGNGGLALSRATCDVYVKLP